MVTGVECAGLVLASFPLIISALEHYGEGLQTFQDWIRFRTDFYRFFSDFVRQKIFFRQHIEDLLSSVVDSDYDMACMLDDPNDSRWQDFNLEVKLKERLPGKFEYESYIATVSSTLDVLEKIRKKLQITNDKPHWTQARGTGLLRLEFERKRVLYILDKKRRGRLINELEKYNSDLQQLLGNSDRLEPTRRKRKAALPIFFEKFRKQATSLHDAIWRSLRCDCSSLHSGKLLLSRSEDAHSIFGENESGESLKLKVYFPRKLQSWSSSPSLVGPEHNWYASDIEMVEADDRDDRQQRKMSSANSVTLLRMGSSPSAVSKRRVSFQQSHGRKLSNAPMVPKDAIEIQDLCAALKDFDHAAPHLGYLRGEDDYCHTIYRSSKVLVSPSRIRKIVTLGELIRQTKEVRTTDEIINSSFHRQERLEVALIMVKALLQLYSSPWLKDNWGKDDVHFFEDNEGNVELKLPFLVNNFDPSQTSYRPISPNTVFLGKPENKKTKAALLSLGILILELWFNKPIESCTWRSNYFGPNGLENEYTTFNTAQKWQEQALEEGGVDLESLTYRCIYCSFGTAKQDLKEEELQRAVYLDVVMPLERILALYKMS